MKTPRGGNQEIVDSMMPDTTQAATPNV